MKYQLLLMFLISSCNGVEYKSENDLYEFKVQKLSAYHSGYTNKTQNRPLKIDAQRIKIKDALAVIYNVDTSNIQVSDETLESKAFKLNIIQKDEKKVIKKLIIEELEKALDLNVKEDIYSSYQLSITDTVKFLNYKSYLVEKRNTVIKNNQGIEIENVSLTKLGEVLSTEYQVGIIAEKYPVKINFKWKQQPFDDLKKVLNEELGLSFVELNKEVKITVTKDKKTETMY